ncbi:hypothetical protein MRB53_019307 [Persea americana]|uniref:Uncharacterized protein n=1 Tax=Persea americana TaxID=3435 RepID=A0ACC2KY93_PERAE|nr:hypothetical protein MRB53_019307 [Persea americana]
MEEKKTKKKGKETERSDIPVLRQICKRWQRWKVETLYSNGKGESNQSIQQNPATAREKAINGGNPLHIKVQFIDRLGVSKLHAVEEDETRRH